MSNFNIIVISSSSISAFQAAATSPSHVFGHWYPSHDASVAHRGVL